MTDKKHTYRRYRTRVVNIGDTPLGGNYPIRIQSMTTTDTMDTKATVEQSIRIIEAGSDYVRITAPSINEAKNLELIKNELRSRGYKTPVIADIHFTPNAAELAAKIVEKVRINPGNYADKKKFNIIEYTESQYNDELDRIRHKFTPLVKICKEFGTAMRIGTNHGSLSDRIMSRFGDTPLGMVESALEFIRICEDLGYFDVVLSMKSSNPQVMIQAYRLLVKKMEEEGMNYPLHLGVTEAGDGEDGRIKSSIGIGTLLEDGFGDTVRVSLTEEPEYEIPVCKNLVDRYERLSKEIYFSDPGTVLNSNISDYNPFEYKRRDTFSVKNIGGNNVPVVILSLPDTSHENLRDAGYLYSETLDKWTIGEASADYIYTEDRDLDYKLPGTLVKIINCEFWKSLVNKEQSIPLLSIEEYLKYGLDEDIAKLVEVTEFTPELKDIIRYDKNCVLVLKLYNHTNLPGARNFFLELISNGIKNPVILKRIYENTDDEILTIHSATDLGGLLIDGFGDGIWVEADNNLLKIINSISFGILQAARTRISKTEYISCPSCGRTLFDLQETTAKVRERTNHLKGLKIAIMGCIVNGPGEMADADYGYVGSGVGKITLYKGKEVVKKAIDSSVAVDELISLIKENGDWIEK